MSGRGNLPRKARHPRVVYLVDDRARLMSTSGRVSVWRREPSAVLSPRSQGMMALQVGLEATPSIRKVQHDSRYDAINAFRKVQAIRLPGYGRPCGSDRKRKEQRHIRYALLRSGAHVR